MRTFVTVLLVMVVSWVGYAQEVPQAPEYDDPQEVVVTVGEMKRALWYYEQYQELYPEYVRQKDAALTAIDQRDRERELRVAAERQREAWKIGTLILGGVTIGSAIVCFLTGWAQ